MANYDSNLKREAVRAVMQFYKRCVTCGEYPHPGNLILILEHQKKRMEGGCKWYNYTIRYTTKSGAYNTCLGNALLNLFTVATALSRCTGFSWEDILTTDVVYMVLMGDDNLLFVPVGIGTFEKSKKNSWSRWASIIKFRINQSF